MSVFHSPRCRIVWTSLVANGVTRDVAAPDQPLEFLIGAEVDPTLRTDPGYWIVYWRVYEETDPAREYKHTWTGLNSNFPAVGSIWLSYTVNPATAFVTGGWGSFLYQAELYFRLGGKARDQFAFSEEPHYFLISQS